MDDEVKTMSAGERTVFDCSVCSRRFAIVFEPDYVNVPDAEAPDSAEVEYCPFCGEPALAFSD